jgi:hypothetical protein
MLDEKKLVNRGLIAPSEELIKKTKERMKMNGIKASGRLWKTAVAFATIAAMFGICVFGSGLLKGKTPIEIASNNFSLVVSAAEDTEAGEGGGNELQQSEFTYFLTLTNVRFEVFGDNLAKVELSASQGALFVCEELVDEQVNESVTAVVGTQDGVALVKRGEDVADPPTNKLTLNYPADKDKKVLFLISGEETIDFREVEITATVTYTDGTTETQVIPVSGL